MAEFWMFVGALAIGCCWLLVGPMLLHLGDRGLTRVAGRIAGIPDEEIERQLGQ